MKIVALIDQNRQPDVVERILKHCPDSKSGWKEPMLRGPPAGATGDSLPQEMTYDSGYFDKSCA
jgi:hypothetical protein